MQERVRREADAQRSDHGSQRITSRGPEAAARAPRTIVQRRLAVGAVNDPAEAEADRMAAEVLRRLSTPGPAASAPGAEHGPDASPAAPAGRVRRSATGGVGAEGGEVDPHTAQRIQASRGAGQPLDHRTRASMESGFGADFSRVRLHTDRSADVLSRQLNATAFTTGADIYFRSGAYSPATSGGRELLAHELAHTVQQGAASVHRSPDPGIIHRAFTVEGTSWGDAKSISASGGASLTGVFFLKDKAGTTLVVKPAVGAARNQLAGEIMDAAGAHGVSQRAILLDSPEGKRLLKVMHKLASKYRRENKTAKGQNPIKKKIESQLESGDFDSVMVMAGYDNLSNMEDLAQSDDFQQVFALMVRNGFFNGLGRTHAADMMMGNEDRLERMNDKNIFVNIWSGQSVGLDLDLNATSFTQATGDLTGGNTKQHKYGDKAPSLAGHEYKDFVNFSIDGISAQRKVQRDDGSIGTSGMGMRGGGMATSDFTKGADPAKAAAVFDDFRQRMIDRADDANKGNRAMLENFDWTGPKAQFLAGVRDGMAALVAKTGDLADRADDLSATFGADDFLDPRVFRIRAMYSQLLGFGVQEPIIRDVLEMYAEHLVSGGDDHDFMHWVRTYFLQQIGKKGPPPKAPDMPELPKAPKPRLKARPRGRVKV